MNVQELIVQWLATNGMDGLYCPGASCGCEKDNLAPCGDWIGDCKPGYKHTHSQDKSLWVISCSAEAMSDDKIMELLS